MDFCLPPCCSGPQLQLELYLRDEELAAASGHDLSAYKKCCFDGIRT